MGRQRSRAEKTLAVNLPQLQNLIKRDPVSYGSEFAQQLRYLESQLQLVAKSPHDPPQKALPELLSFIAQTVPSYHAKVPAAAAVPAQLMDLLRASATVIHPDTRRAIVSALVHLHNRGVVDSLAVLPLFFHLFRCRDKTLRETLHTFIVQDIKTANAKHTNNKLNKAIQNLLYAILTPPPGYTAAAAGSTANGDDEDATGFSPVAAQKALQICIELYKKNLWTDAKTVNVIAEACFSPVAKIMSTAVHFFIGADNTEEQGDASDDEDGGGGATTADTKAMHHAQHVSKITKKSRANARKLDKIVAAAKRSTKSKGAGAGRDGKVHFSALSLIYDPQSFAEKLFARVKGAHFAFDTKLQLLNLVSRVIASHKLFILSFYTFMQKYLQPHQRNVTGLLAYTAQAAHDLVPPDVLGPVLRVIADQFVTDHASREVVAAGLNSIREICARCPLAMDTDLLADLVQYKEHRDKSVVMAARSLIGLYREVNPGMLPKNERGKSASMQMQAGIAASLEFGRVAAATRVAGAELLDMAVADGDATLHDDGDDAAWDGWAAEDSDDSDSDDGEWHNVSSGDEGDDGVIQLSDDSDDEDDEKPAKESKKAAAEENEEEAKAEDEEQTDADAPPSGPAPLPIEATRFLTPADFARMAELRAAAEASTDKDPKNSKKRKRAAALLANAKYEVTEFVNEDSLVPLRKKPKSDYEERMASIAAGREGREKFGSRMGKKEGKSTSNLEKRRTKDYNMVAKSRRVSGKHKASLRDKTRGMRKHIDKQKLGRY
ncbi:Severe Depolymerization of Actin [Blastocladiella emersonii ATCC 22665]|nr:Severe Depolymerization of Actin [Blastocladiella emersonii ATCC 22665]